MQSIFRSDFFGSRSLGWSNSISLGQDITDIQGMTSGIEGYLKQLPPDVLGVYNARYQACMAQVSAGGLADTALGAKCLYDLYKDLKKLVENGPPKPLVVQAPAAFPVIPVLVGVAGLGVLVWGLTKL